ncbi:MAG: cell division protein FtsH, partial [Mycobacterium sp.]
LNEYRDILDILAGELLEKETLHRPELQAIFANVDKRPRLTVFDDFGGRIPSDKPPIKTPGELAIERGEPWPPPVREPAFKAAIAQASQAASQAADAARAESDRNAHGGNGSGDHHGSLVPHGSHAPVDAQETHQGVPHAHAQPDYGAPAGWRAPGWPPPEQQAGYWHPAPQAPPAPYPPQAPQQPYWPQPAQSYPGYPGHPGYPGASQPPYPPYPPPGNVAPDAGHNPPAQG